MVIDLLQKGTAGFRSCYNNELRQKRSKQARDNFAAKFGAFLTPEDEVLKWLCCHDRLRSEDFDREKAKAYRSTLPPWISGGLITNLESFLIPRTIRVLTDLICQLHPEMILSGYVQGALRLWRGFCEILCDAEIIIKRDGFRTSDFLFFLRHHLDADHRKNINYAKWWSTTLLAKFLKNEHEPSAPGWHLLPLPAGPLKRRLMRCLGQSATRTGAVRKENFHLFSSIQQLKRCLPAVDEDFVLQSLRKHRKAMMRPPGSMDRGFMFSTAFPNEKGLVPVTSDYFLAEFEKKFTSIMSRWSFSEQDFRLLQPSPSACFEATRASGGASEFIARKVYDAPGLDLGHGDLLEMSFHPHVGVIETRGIPFPDSSEILLETALSLLSIERQNDLVRQGFIRRVKCRVGTVLEPAKVRTVTAGEALPYWLTRAYQQSIHGYLKKFTQFSLIGAPLTKWHLQFLDRTAERFGFDLDSMRDGEKTVWVSGDFSAATDTVDIRLTRICQDVCERQIASCWNGSPTDLHNLTRVLRSAIETHEVHYPKNHQDADEKRRSNHDHTILKLRLHGMNDDELRAWCECAGPLHPFETVREKHPFRDTAAEIQLLESEKKDFLTITQQQNGQLMGSTLSFPILCLINFVAAWIALFPHEEDFNELPILVNGDDILFRCPESLVPRWYDSIINAGFSRSVGKNFVHKRAIFINSEPWLSVKRKDGICDFVPCPFFNVGLMHGQSKVAKSPTVLGGNVFQPLYSLQPEAVRGARNQSRAVKRFNRIHREHLRFASADGYFSHHLPECYLGLGMTGCEKSEVSVSQRRLCSAIWSRAQDEDLRIRDMTIFSAKHGKSLRPEIGDSNTLHAMHDLSRAQARPAFSRSECIKPLLTVGNSRQGFTILRLRDRKTWIARQYPLPKRIEHSLSEHAVADGEDVMFTSAFTMRRHVINFLRSSTLAPMPIGLCELGFTSGRDALCDP